MPTEHIVCFLTIQSLGEMEQIWNNLTMSNISWGTMKYKATTNVSAHNQKFSGTEYLLLLTNGDREIDLSEESGNFIFRFDGFQGLKLSSVIKLKLSSNKQLIGNLSECLDVMHGYACDNFPKKIRSFYLILKDAKSDLAELQPYQIDTLRTLLMDGQNLVDALNASLLL